jgi:hypothetical protein
MALRREWTDGAFPSLTQGAFIAHQAPFPRPRHPARTGPLAEHPVTDVLRTCNHARNDRRCLDGRANNAARGDANVRAYGHAKRRYYRLHPQPTLARRRRPISPDWAGPIPHGRVHENKVGRYCHRRTCSRGRSGECTTPDDRLASAILGLGRFQCNPSRDRLSTIAATSSVTRRAENPSPTRGGT